MAIKLSEGAITRILSGDSVDKPILQLLGHKKIPGGGSNDRFRLLLSDGLHIFSFGMLASQLNHYLTSGELDKFGVIQMNKYICNQVNPEKRVLILLDLTIIASAADVGDKIGNPQQLNPESLSNNPNETKPAAVNENMKNGFGPKPPMGSNFNNNPSTFGGGSSSSNRPNAFMPNSSNASTSGTTNIHPISSLTPYQNKWTIRARVTSKSAVRTWNNSRGEGKLFSMDLLDESGEIRATAFKDQCDKFYGVIEPNKVYYFSKGILKTANKSFTSIKNEYELTFNNETTVIPCNEHTDIPSLQFEFVPISRIQETEKDTMIDILGICKSCGDVETIITKTTNRELKKREIHLVDKTNTEVNLTLWSEEAEKFDGTNNPVIAVKGVRVSDFSGRSLSMVGSSTLQINPDIREAHILRGWYDREGVNQSTQSISVRGGNSITGAGAQWKTFSQVKAEAQDLGDRGNFYTTKATVVMIKKDNCLYMACPSAECNKKVIDMQNGSYRCEKCNREYNNFKWRLILQACLADFSDNQWVTCFQESAEKLLDTTAEELGALKESNEEKYEDIISRANFRSYFFKLRTKMEMYNEESRLKTSIMQATPLDPVEYGRKLLADIRQLEGSLQ